MNRQSYYNIAQRTAFIILALMFFLISVDMLSNSFKYLGKDIANSLIYATSNPFIGLFVGIIVTAIIQSSSTSTTMIVAFVASNVLTLTDAVPMMIGANIGTTITSTLVSIGFISKRKEFRRAVSAGVIHDFFNIFMVLILFPLEYYYGIISKTSISIASFIYSTANLVETDRLISPLISSGDMVAWILQYFNFPVVIVILAFLLLLLSIKVLSKFIYSIISGGSADTLKKYFFGSNLHSFFWGVLLTAGVLSSSVTTSLIVPFVATGKVKLKKAFHFILGANIGTTLTAIVAAIFRSEAALAIAFAHLLFNVIGVLLFLSVPILRKWILNLARLFARKTMRYRILGFVYILTTFFLIPFGLIYLSDNQSIENQLPPVEEVQKLNVN